MKHVDHLIDLLLDDRLDETQALQVREHCRKCDACGQRLAEAEELLDVFSLTPAPPLGESIWPDVQAQLDTSPVRPAAPAGRLGFAFSGIAAVVSGLMLGLWLTPSQGDERAMPSIMEQGVTLVGDSSETLDQLFLIAGSDVAEDVPGGETQ